MRLKHTLLVFIIGIIFGIGISPWVSSKPQEKLHSPITLAQAEESLELETSVPAGEVLGSSTVKVTRRQAIDDLLIRQDKELGLFDDEQAVAEEEASLQKPFQNLTTKEVTIAVYGDSMVDTMGTGLPYLEPALRQYYPRAQFNLLNYGIGAETVDKGLARFGQNYSYKDRNYPPITQVRADIIIIESFAYNPQGEAGLDTQWSALSQMVNQAQASGAQVILLATIAPTKSQFGQGPGGVNWPADQAFEHANLINQYLKNAVRLAQSIGVPLVDAYHASLLGNGEGNLTYISSHDHIHPSVAGHQFVAGLIARTIADLKSIN